MVVWYSPNYDPIFAVLDGDSLYFIYLEIETEGCLASDCVWIVPGTLVEQED